MRLFGFAASTASIASLQSGSDVQSRTWKHTKEIYIKHRCYGRQTALAWVGQQQHLIYIGLRQIVYKSERMSLRRRLDCVHSTTRNFHCLPITHCLLVTCVLSTEMLIVYLTVSIANSWESFVHT